MKRVDFSSQNTIFTLLIALLCLCLIEKITEKYGESNKALKYLLIALSILSGSAVTFIIKSDYGVYGFLAVMSMYLLRKKRVWGSAIGIMVLCCNSILEIFSVIDLILIGKYNGLRGKANKWLFYIFYPTHLLLLGILATRI